MTGITRPAAVVRVAVIAALAASLALPRLSNATAASPSRVPPAKVVLAFVDQGIDPYHDDFAAPEMTAAPSTYLPGFPRDATALHLSLDEPDYARARARDDSTWAGVTYDRLYWIPGTRIIGAIAVPGSAIDNAQHVTVDTAPTGPGRRLIVDNSPHGTKVASVGAGATHGSCPTCLIVMVSAASNDAGLAWAARQPWIDVISNSFGGPAGAPTGGTVAGQTTTGRIDRISRDAAASGKVVVFASGNGLTGTGPYAGATPDHGLTWTSPYSGPPWVIAVGAASPANRQPTGWHDVPVDVISYGKDWPAAAAGTLRDESLFMGTSCAAPIAAGVASEILRRVRAVVDDRHVGARGGALASGRRPGGRAALSDGRLSAGELTDALLRTARWPDFTPADVTRDPFITPTTGAAYSYAGYGLVDTETIAPATDGLLGRAQLPARAEMTEWRRHQDNIRTALWGPRP